MEPVSHTLSHGASLGPCYSATAATAYISSLHKKRPSGLCTSRFFLTLRRDYQARRKKSALGFSNDFMSNEKMIRLIRFFGPDRHSNEAMKALSRKGFLPFSYFLVTVHLHLNANSDEERGSGRSLAHIGGLTTYMCISINAMF